MRLEDICRGLSQEGSYSVQPVDGILRIRNLENASEYVLETFGLSAQIRQAVWFDCQDLSEEDLNRVYRVCSMMNERFSGCKCYIDEWGVLITGADILGDIFTINSLEVALSQVEFISQAMLGLMEILRIEQRLVTRDEIDSALDVPALQ